MRENAKQYQIRLKPSFRELSGKYADEKGMNFTELVIRAIENEMKGR
jgi:hypothetical protein